MAVAVSTSAPDRSVRLGGLYAFGAYLVWGLFPAYWKQLAGVEPGIVIAHRIAWSFLFVLALIGFGRRWGELRDALRAPRTLGLLALTTSLISSNWLLFIWAVNTGRVTEASLGYYINPLLNVLLARIFLGERLRRLQLFAVLVASAGVLFFTLGVGVFPWVSLVLATTFGIYGLLRKQAPVESLVGLTVETGLATPVAVAYLLWAGTGGTAVFGSTLRNLLFLAGSGAATAIPLLWFALGARRLRYTTMGILQYVAPTCQLGLAVLAYGEPFTLRHAVTFGLIWTAVALYAVDGLLARRRALPPSMR